ncbi:MAG: hypothetical protein HW402_636, partial [Dehalococcoidales bacterium]|nr:hypothetical protein [Dehalococcoidales bacterium]
MRIECEPVSLDLRPTAWFIHQPIHVLPGKPDAPFADHTSTYLQ